jgi:hypothetical protein
MIRIAIDADGVIFNFLEPFKEIASELTRREINDISTAWNLCDRFDMSKEEVSETFDLLNKYGLWASLPILEDADKAIHQLLKCEAEIIVVSSMPQDQAHKRLEALARYGLHLPVVAVGVGNGKINIYQNFKPDFVIDDYMLHINEAKQLGIPHRILIESCVHKENTSSATAIFNNLVDAIPHILEGRNNYAKVA